MLIDPALAFHTGERQAQALSGLDAPRTPPIRDHMPDQHREFFAALPFLLLATEQEGWPVPTILTGAPGFLQSPDPQTLTIAALPAPEDPAAALLRPDALVGMLGIDLATRRRNRMNGRIASAGPNGLEIDVLESFGNCPKYINRRELQPIPAGPGEPIERFEGLDRDAADAVATSDALFVASFAAGGVDISHRGGVPGFVTVEGARLSVPDFSGNRYFNTLGNLLLNPKAAILLVDFERGDLLCLQGLAEIEWRADDAPGGAERVWRLAVQRGWRRRAALPLRWRRLNNASSLD